MSGSVDDVNRGLHSAFTCAAKISKAFGMQDDAKTTLKRAFCLNPDDVVILDEFPECKDAILYIRSVVLRLTKKKTQKLADLETLGFCYAALDDFPRAYSVYNRLIDVYEIESVADETLFAMATVYQRLRRNDRAVTYFEMFLGRSEHEDLRSDAVFRLAIVNRDCGHDCVAIDLFSSVKEAPPPGLRREDIILQIAYTLQRQHMMDDAGKIYRELRMDFPNLLPITQQYVWFQYTNSTRMALIQIAEILGRALQQHPSDPVLLLQSARVAMKRDDMVTAYQSYRDCVGFWRDTPSFWCGLGIVYCRSDQMGEAVSAFQRSLFLKSDMEESWLNLGAILENQGDVASAKRIYMTALQNCPGSVALRERMHMAGSLRPTDNLPFIDVDDSHYYKQVPEEFADTYTSALPKPCIFRIPEAEARALDALSTLPKSLFG